jgi:hypothetical protein
MTDKEKRILKDGVKNLIGKYKALEHGIIEVLENNILFFIDSLLKEPVSEDLEEACKEWLRPQLDKSYANYGEAKMMELTRFDGYAMLDAIEFGAQWQKTNLWKPADGDDLPEIDKEVIVLTQPYPLENSEYVVSFAHRPNPDGWDGKSITTGEIEHYTPKTYDKGGWNIPDVKFWLDCELPKME